MAVEVKSVAVIGCGWLGFPLAQMLIEEGYRVKGSTRSRKKQQMLIDADIEAHILDIYNDKAEISQDIGDVDIAIINIPPGRGVEDVVTRYPRGIARLLQDCKGLKDEFVVFISSTGVYANTYDKVDEESVASPVRPSGKALVQSEGIIREHCQNHVILRLSGLVGPGRDPGSWFAGKSDLPGGDTPVNMVHLTDCLDIILLMIGQQPNGEVYNVTAPIHPIKREFYAQQSAKTNVDPPTFLDGVLPHKIVSHEKLVLTYDYQYKYPDPRVF